MADRQKRRILGFHENKPVRAVLRLSNGVLQMNPENRLWSLMLGQVGHSALVLDGYTGCMNIQGFRRLLNGLSVLRIGRANTRYV